MTSSAPFPSVAEPSPKHKGGRPRKDGKLRQRGAVSMRALAKELGMPESSMRRYIKAAEDYRALPPEFRARVDSGEWTLARASSTWARWFAYWEANIKVRADTTQQEVAP